jgi:hypothetical protein
MSPVAGSVAQAPPCHLTRFRHLRLLARARGLVVGEQGAAGTGQRSAQQRRSEATGADI